MPAMSDLHVAFDHTVLIADTAAYIHTLSAQALARHGVFHWALSGGSTPRALFQLLATPDWVGQFDWAKIHLWWSDERDVPSDAPDSNYKMAHDALISQVPISIANVHRVPTELGAEPAAQAYQREVLQTLKSHPPQFDLILLGMGDDGHTASLFPGTAAIFEKEQLVIAHFVPKVNMMRITFTAPLINAAHTVMFLVSGASKAITLRRVLYEIDQPNVLPAQIVSPTSGELIWAVDAAAASRLGESDGQGEGNLEDIYRKIPKP